MEEILPRIDIRKRLREIKDRGFIKSLRENNTGIGYTLEKILGIKENNVGEPDFIYNDLKVELKSQRKKASSRITLSTKSPIWDPLKDREIISKLGYIDKKKRQGLKVTLKIEDYNKKGFKLDLNLSEDRLNIIHKIFGIVCYFRFTELVKSVKIKLYQNLLLVLAEREKKEENEFFHYTEAILFSNFNEGKFRDLLIGGKIIWEFRMHLKESGSARDHGSGLRIGRKYLSQLFDNEEKIL